MKKLLLEAVIGQRDFVLDAIEIIRNKPDVVRKNNKIYRTLIKSFRKNRLNSELMATNKGARKKAQILVMKEVSKLNGLDGEPIRLGAFKQLYEPMLKFLSASSDVTLDDCILASDIFIKKYYDSIDEVTKREVDIGEVDFGKIFYLTNFYKEYLGVDEERGKENWFKILETDELEVVFPLSYNAFKRYIKLTGVKDLTWCTQDEDTYYSYSSDYYLCIIHSKKKSLDDKNKIISLKIDRDYEIQAYETCDRYNAHMNDRSLKEVLSEDMIDKIEDIAYDRQEFFFPKDNLTYVEQDQITRIANYIYASKNINIASSTIRILCSHLYDEDTGSDLFYALMNFKTDDFLSTLFANLLKSERVLNAYIDIEKYALSNGLYDYKAVFRKHAELCLKKGQSQKYFRNFCRHIVKEDDFLNLDKDFYLESLNVVFSANNINETNLTMLYFFNLLERINKNYAKEVLEYCVLNCKPFKNLIEKQHDLVVRTEVISKGVYDFFISSLGGSEEEIIINTIYSGDCVDVLNIADPGDNYINVAAQRYDLIRPDLLNDDAQAAVIMCKMNYFAAASVQNENPFTAKMSSEFVRFYFWVLSNVSHEIFLQHISYYSLIETKMNHIRMLIKMLETIGENVSYLKSVLGSSKFLLRKNHDYPGDDDDKFVWETDKTGSIVQFAEQYFKVFKFSCLEPHDFETYEENFQPILKLFTSGYSDAKFTKLLTQKMLNEYIKYKDFDLKTRIVNECKGLELDEEKILLTDDTVSKLIDNSIQTYNFQSDPLMWVPYITQKMPESSSLSKINQLRQGISQNIDIDQEQDLDDYTETDEENEL